ncbi:MAG: pseudouridine synthase [Bacilli bacterium]|nr:pseudouridine synthase [Bacilli bacterium]MDD4718782.1 pseudouridine synthase [Bacilli bacterium]
MERIQKVIANYGYCSRRKAEELLIKGKVKVNGEIITELGFKVGPKDIIEVEGHILEKQEKEYILLNKPRGVVTTVSDDKKRKTVIDLVPSNNRLFPVGRLDYNTTGLLLLTNDGELANLIMHPKNEIEKVYIAKIKGILSVSNINNLEQGILIEGIKTSKSKVKIRKIDKKNNSSIVELIIHEGKNHQVKKMFNAVGHEVLKLKRERLAFLTLTGLDSGQFRHLNPKEVKQLYNEILNSER